ncbi:type II toxin-antitoxin system PemK/MazF family toxin [Candidatus Collierbacteria bacterium]|nr:type II toxin-antitoxin system PemK/MazF family toxin [Candidatus Collierbacteria bacterium]
MVGYLKVFRAWFKLKVLLWKKDKTSIVFKQGDIWWCSVGMNLGEEIFGKGEKFTRPVLVYRKFTSDSFLGLPLTSKEKQGSWYVGISLHGKMSWVILNQARIFDKKRLTNKIGALDDAEVKKVKKKFLKLYAS